MAYGSQRRSTFHIARKCIILNLLTGQIGLDVKTKLVEDMTEVVEITEEVDEEKEIEDEVLLFHLKKYQILILAS